jgi:hypothetical protein
VNSRTTRSTVTFAHPFRIAGYEDELPAGDYEVVVDEDLLEGLSFEAYRRTASFLMIEGQAGGRGQAEMRPIDPRDLDAALARDQGHAERR